MAGTVTYSRILRGKYRIARNVYAICRLDVLEADDQEMRLFLGLKYRADTAAAVGTRIFLDSNPINQPGGSSEPPEIVCLSLTVKEVQNVDGKPLLVCSGMQRETLTERRHSDRKTADFPIRLAMGEAHFRVTGGTTRGLTLQAVEAQKTLVNLRVDRDYEFVVNHKETDYKLSATIKHIHYDWKSYRHRLGVALAPLSRDMEIVINVLLDPKYTIPISNKQTIDTSQGKISPD